MFFILGVDILNKAINKLTSRGGVWRTILIEISVSNIRITDCTVWYTYILQLYVISFRWNYIQLQSFIFFEVLFFLRQLCQEKIYSEFSVLCLVFS